MFFLKLHKPEYYKKLHKVTWWQAPLSGPLSCADPTPRPLSPQLCGRAPVPQGAPLHQLQLLKPQLHSYHQRLYNLISFFKEAISEMYLEEQLLEI